MTLTELKTVLNQHQEKKLTFILPNQQRIPAEFHITEVGHVKKDFIDCGGTLRSTSSCLLQAWVALNDEAHSLSAGKLAAILELAAKLFPSGDLPVELEYEETYPSQFPLTSVETSENHLVFQLGSKHTDCLAKEQCGLEGASSCCSPEESTCCS